MLIYYGHEYGVEYQGITYFIKMLNATTYLTYAETGNMGSYIL